MHLLSELSGRFLRHLSSRLRMAGHPFWIKLKRPFRQDARALCRRTIIPFVQNDGRLTLMIVWTFASNRALAVLKPSFMATKSFVVIHYSFLGLSVGFSGFGTGRDAPHAAQYSTC